jgi:hypothetical protein
MRVLGCVPLMVWSSDLNRRFPVCVRAIETTHEDIGSFITNDKYAYGFGC